ncbi:MAG: CoA transferase [Myxococcota bacterium]
MTKTETTATGPCVGIRVLDLTTVVSGPFCTQTLGDLGADVIKVEPPHGDSSRYTGTLLAPGHSGMMAQFNRNKRSIVLDLSREDAREVARTLANRSDVLVENFRPGVAERLGLGWEQLRESNPELVHVSINGFGPDGPYAKLPAYDHVIQALTGHMPTQGGAGAPKPILGSIADKTTGMAAVTGVLGALLARERGGRGQKVDVPMLDAYAAFILPEAMVRRSFPSKEAEGADVGDVFRAFETADGFVVGLAVLDDQYQGLCEAVGLEELRTDERFVSATNRFANYAELVAILVPELRKWPTAEFVERARSCGVPFAPVNDVDGFLADPQVAHNATVQTIDDERYEPTRYLRHPVRYERTPANVRQHAPKLGEHTDELLAEAGYDAATIAALREAGAVR